MILDARFVNPTPKLRLAVSECRQSGSYRGTTQGQQITSRVPGNRVRGPWGSVPLTTDEKMLTLSRDIIEAFDKADITGFARILVFDVP